MRCFILWLGLATLLWGTRAVAADPAPLRVLLVAGGCCHNYAAQVKILEEGIESRCHADVEVVLNPEKSAAARFPLYEQDDWAKGFDVVVHDECTANVSDAVYVERILRAHREGVPAVALHCAMHSFRWGDYKKPVAAGADNARWFEFIGVQSTGHGPQQPIEIMFTDINHPIVKSLEGWTTSKEELYNSVQVLPTATPLASGRQIVPPKAKKGEPPDPAAKPTVAEAVIAWTNEYGPKKTRLFATSLGHNNVTVADPRYLDLVVRGLLWSVGKIDASGRLDAAAIRESASGPDVGN